MTVHLRSCLVMALALLCAACAGQKPNLPGGADAYSVISAPGVDSTPGDYLVGPLDTLQVTVFQEPDLSFEKIQVDASGNLTFPLIGTVRAQGKTSSELSREIALALGQKYLVNPQVTVLVTASISQRFTVEGQVTEPGVYDIAGTTTLLEAIARAKSPTRSAKLDQIIVFRTIDGQRMGAIFDLKAIRNGDAPDPQILGGDVIVVGFSQVKGAWQDILRAAPLAAFANVFRAF